MESLLEKLEDLLDQLDNQEYEVDYSVRITHMLVQFTGLDFNCTEWCPDTETWGKGDVCHQQATSEQTDMAFLAIQACRPSISHRQVTHVNHAADQSDTTMTQATLRGFMHEMVNPFTGCWRRKSGMYSESQ